MIYRIHKYLTQWQNDDGTTTVHWSLTTHGLEDPNLNPIWIVAIEIGEPFQRIPTRILRGCGLLHHGNQTHNCTDFSTNEIGNAHAKTHHKDLAQAILTIPAELRVDMLCYERKIHQDAHKELYL